MFNFFFNFYSVNKCFFQKIKFSVLFDDFSFFLIVKYFVF